MLEQLESLADQLHQLEAQPRKVPAGASETLGVPLPHWVVDARHHDGNRRGCLLHCGQRGRYGDDHIHLEIDDFGDQARETFGSAFSRSSLGHGMLSVYVAEFA